MMSELDRTPAIPVEPPVEPVAPVITHPDAITTYTYPLPHAANETPQPDTASHAEFSEYMKSRLEPRAAGSDPTLVRYPVNEPAVHRLREGWHIKPRVAAAVMVGTFVLFNAVGNAGSAIADAREAASNAWHNLKDRVASARGHDQPTTAVVGEKVPGQTIVIDQMFLESRGKSQPNAADVDALVDQLQGLTAQDHTITRIAVNGSASDEWGRPRASLARPDAGNDDISGDRAANLATALQTSDAKDGKKDLPDITISNAENILDQNTMAALEAEAANYGLSLEEAMAIFENNPGKLQPGLRATLKRTIADQRGAKAHVELKTPDTFKTTAIRGQKHDQDPVNKNHDYNLYWMLLPMIPIPRYRREDYLKPGYKEWTRPGTKPDQRWVELDQEALQQDGTLPNDAWRYTRKYMQLAREDRIDYVLTHRYTDAQGEERELRAMFVDHDPTDATIEAFKAYMNDAAQMQDGRIAERFSMISVFPSSQAGVKKSYPEHMGLGIDKQDPAGVVGVAAPTLGLIEMHMPEDPTDQELYGFNGALHTLAHELNGHGTDVKDKPIRLTQVGPTAVRHYQSNNPWTDTGAPVYDTYADVDAEGERVFEVTRRIATKGGTIVPLTSVVKEDDRRLTEAVETRLLDRKPTEYSDTSSAEMYAEVAAQTTVGFEIPYSQTGMYVPTVHPDLAQGYHVDPELKKMYEDHTGWSRETASPVNQDEFTLSTALDDPMVGKFIVDARANPMPQDRITILATVRS